MIKNFCAIAVIIAAMSFSIANAATNEKFLDAAVFDNTGSLSNSEIRQLADKIRTVENKHGIKIGIEFLDTIGNASMESAAKSLLDRHYSGAPNGGIILLVVMDQRNWQISTDARMRTQIPNAYDIGNVIVRNLSGGDYFGACENYIDSVDKILTYYEQNGTAYDSSDAFNPMAAAFAVVGGIFFGVMVRSWLIGSMTNVRHAAAATDYLKRETVKFDTKRDTYLFTNVQRVPKNQGGGGGGSGFSGGGGSHGGGGGAGGSF